jgi:hypothetical protein
VGAEALVGMSTPGDHRRAQRRAAREEPKPQTTELTPIEDAIRRALAKNAREEKLPDDDARVIARLVVKHWGDDAVRVLERALEFTREKLGR